MEQIDRLSWRQFRVLLANASPYGAVAARADEIRRKPTEDAQNDEMQANAFFSSMLSTRATNQT